MIFLESVKARVRDALRAYIRQEVDREVSERLLPVLPQLLEYRNSPPERRQSFYDHTLDPIANRGVYQELSQRIERCGVRTEEFRADVADFRKWMGTFPEIDHFYRPFGDVHIQKCIEHYLSYTLLGLSRADVFVDVAAAASPFARLLRRRIGLAAYRLDMRYRPGLHGYDIGADAGETGLPGDFASAMALHCAYECFAGDADIRFVQEAGRILKPGGRLVIVPLYLHDSYFIMLSPYSCQEGVVTDRGALRVWRDDSFRDPFSRHYSPESFTERIYARMPSDMTGTVYYVRNLPDFWKAFEGQRIYCFFVFHCAKAGSA